MLEMPEGLERMEAAALSGSIRLVTEVEVPAPPAPEPAATEETAGDEVQSAAPEQEVCSESLTVPRTRVDGVFSLCGEQAFDNL